MSESAGITLLETQVKAVTGFGSSNVAVANWKLLNKGAAANYAILRPGPASRRHETFATVGSAYRSVIEVWQRYNADGSTLTSLLGYCDAIINRLDQYRKLADTTTTLLDANVTGMGEVTEQWVNHGDGPSWLKREIYVDWTEEDNVSYAE